MKAGWGHGRSAHNPLWGRQTRRGPRLAASLFVGAIHLAAAAQCALAAPDVPPDTLVYVETTWPQTLDPITATQMSELRLCQLLFDSVCYRTWSATILEDLGKVTLVEQGRAALVQVREGVKWSDGEPFSIGDVVHTLRILLNQETDCKNWPYRDCFSQSRFGAGLTKVDKRSLEIDLTQHLLAEPDAVFTFKVVPRHKLPDGWYRRSRGRAEREMLTFARDPVGTGPYRVKRVSQRERKIWLQAREDYHWGQPKIPQIIMWVTDPLAAIEKKQAHMVPEANIQQLDTFRSERTLTLVPSQKLAFWYLGFNQHHDRGPLYGLFARRVRLRQAFAAALDEKKGDCLGAFRGYGVRLNAPLAGWQVGTRVQMDHEELKAEFSRVQSLLRGRPLLIKYKQVAGTGMDVICQRICEQFGHALSEYAIKVESRGVQPLNWGSEIEQDGKFDLLLHVFNYPHSYDLSPFFASDGARNLLGFSDDEVNSLFVDWRDETNPNTKAEFFAEINKALSEQGKCPVVYLLAPKGVAIIRDSVKDWTLHPAHFFPTVGIQNWTLE